MRAARFKNMILLLIPGSLLGCRQIYSPPTRAANLNWLVVDGILVDGPDSTIINLSRTENLTDSSVFTPNPETGASVTVTGVNGDHFNLTESSPGRYTSPGLGLQTGMQYRLNILTAQGVRYQSDTIRARLTPPIDSINWQFQPDGVHIYASTHDPTNSARYYRWRYQETWEYHPAYESVLIYKNGLVVQRDSSQMVYNCWHNDSSTNLILASSANLSDDIIYQQPVLTIPRGSQQISVEYSVNVQQYVLDASAYNYWLLLQQNTEQLGSLFDAQPSQLNGNIHNLSNPNEPVLGYVTASTVQQQRIFINTYQILTWDYPAPSLSCLEIVVPPDPESMAYYFGAGYVPINIDFPPSGFAGYFAALATCVDCTLQGGSLVRPAYWP